MDVFKLAFETTIVGLLTFVWLALALDLLFPTFFKAAYDKYSEKYQNALGIALLTLAYCFGSAITPISGQLMNDEHWPLPEFAIRCWVTVKERWLLGEVDGNTSLLKDYTPTKDFMSSDEFNDCRCSYLDLFFDHTKSGQGLEFSRHLSVPRSLRTLRERLQQVEGDEPHRQRLLTLFAIYESRVMGDLSDKNDALKQLHERIIVLRGAVINGALLFILCLFRTLARTNTEKFQWQEINRVWIKTVVGLALAALLTGLAIYNGCQDLAQPNIFDMPILEFLFGLATIFGGYCVFVGVPYRSFLNKRTLFVTVFLTLVAYGGWIWSEVIYDQQIILAIAVAQKASAAHP